MDLKDPNVEILSGITQGGALNALQLAAKLHELVLVASLGNILMHVAHSHLVGKHGLPVGMLANSFAVGSGDYLRTKAYWSSIVTGKAHYWRFWLLSLLATLLATLAGPSSAIAIIPSLNWFSIGKPFTTMSYHSTCTIKVQCCGRTKLPRRARMPQTPVLIAST